jgi:ankyrin repeat protein
MNFYEFILENGHLLIVRHLVESAGADLEQETKKGLRALHLAALRGHIQIVHYLVSKGAMIDALTADGSSPIMLAVAYGKFPVIKFFLEKNAKLDLINNLNDTVLNIAEKSGQAMIFEYLKNEFQTRGLSIEPVNNTNQELQNISSAQTFENADHFGTFSTKIEDGSIPSPIIGPSCSGALDSLPEKQVWM